MNNSSEAKTYRNSLYIKYTAVGSFLKLQVGQ